MSVTKYRHHIDTIKGEDYVLHKDYTELMENLEQKIERLNNIIDGLEKWLKQETIDLYDEDNPLLLDASFTKYATERKMAYMYVLDKLEELKEAK